MGFDLVATAGTFAALDRAGVRVRRIMRLNEGRPNIADLVANRQTASDLSQGLAPQADFHRYGFGRAVGLDPLDDAAAGRPIERDSPVRDDDHASGAADAPSLNSLTLSGGTLTVNGVTLSVPTWLQSAGELRGTGGLTVTQSMTMNGSGTLILSGTNAYTGGTFVNSGTMIQTSRLSLPEGSSLTIGAGGTFIYDPSQAVSGGPMILAGPSSFSSSVSPVPEPSTFALLVAGLVVGFGAWRRRRK
jgi:autotransporter-associated beta strand protein